jgi:hypothetical protein
MVYKLYDSDIAELLKRPETGMGYQVVEASVHGRSSTERFVVYNAQLAITDDLEFKSNKRAILRDGFSTILNKSEKLPIVTTSIKVLNGDEIRTGKDSKNINFSSLETKTADKNRQSGGQGAIDGKKENANGTEMFVRVSAYADDKRIDDVNKKLRPGSFTTTEKDYKDCVSLNDNPIDRYALPNDEKIEWAFYIQPKSVDVLQRGIAQPAFDHGGGGIEIYFENGTSDGTYIGKREYGK